MANHECVAVFVDTENLTGWLAGDGLNRLWQELSKRGPVIIRKAYGRWEQGGLARFQAKLNQMGFELVHTYHPVSRKNSADIQLTVDAMGYAHSMQEVRWFVLATGDSDFGPLFRRLRESGKEVIGVGPRSALSESVKTSCNQYIYIGGSDPEADSGKDEGAGAEGHQDISGYDDSVELVESTLQTFDEPAKISALTNRMRARDTAFDVTRLGFKTFLQFLRAVDSVTLANAGVGPH